MRDLVILFLDSLFMTFLGQKIPLKFFSPKIWLFKERLWEKGGDIYQQLFRVKSWKTSLPEVGDFIKSVFKKKHLWEFTKDYLSCFILESCKAELTHWIIIVSAFLISWWDRISVSWAVFWFSVLLNSPYIIIQRYNRPRILKLVLNNVNWDFPNRKGY
jgi:glycosyl-4,4'-diaponeurosporenoate acyltransferase